MLFKAMDTSGITKFPSCDSFLKGYLSLNILAYVKDKGSNFATCVATLIYVVMQHLGHVQTI
jgi:hypothetical protein